MSSKLHKRLGLRRGESVLSIATDQYGTLNDDRIVSVTITRGDDDGIGVQHSTIEMTIAGAMPAVELSTQGVAVTLAPAALRLVTGLHTARPRFTGRLLAAEMNDTDDKRPHLRTTTLQGNDRLSLVESWDDAQPIYAANNAKSTDYIHQYYRSLVQTLFNTTEPGILSIYGPDSTWPAYDWNHSDDTPTAPTLSTLLGNLSYDAGNLLRHRRDGQLEAFSTAALMVRAQSWQTYNPNPLHRSQVLSPVTWRQRPAAARFIRYDAGEIVTGRYPPDNAGTRGLPTETVDIPLKYVFGLMVPVATARGYRTAEGLYRVDEVTVDIGALLVSDRSGDRAQAAQLLSIETGHCIALSNDWPAAVSSVVFVTRIVETYTADSWQMVLSLRPYQHIIGEFTRDSDRPNPAGPTWDTQAGTWNAASGNWT